MSRFRIEFVASAAKDYRRLDAALQPRILKALDRIAEQPLEGKPLQGPWIGLRSYRVGEYRIVYRMDVPSRSVLIYRLGHRREIYR